MVTPMLQVRSNALVYFLQSDKRDYSRYSFQQSPQAAYSGTMTGHARKRLSSALDIMLQLNPTRRIFNPISETWHDFRINFITLTVSDQRNISHRDAYDKLLSKWLRYMRDKMGVTQYVWKCELQQRGQVHYHICTNSFIDWRVVRWKWNKVQKEAGLLDTYAKKHGTFNANSTDVHAVEKVNDIHRYISKELYKQTFLSTVGGHPVNNLYYANDSSVYKGTLTDPFNGNRQSYQEWNKDLTCKTFPVPDFKLKEAQIDGKVWDCSEKLKMKRFTTVCDDRTWYSIEDGIKWGSITKNEIEHCTIYKTMEPLNFLSIPTLNNYRTYLK